MQAMARAGFRTLWAAGEVADFDVVTPYRQLVAITCELGPNNWLAEALPRADQHTWLEVWRACEGLYRRSGAHSAGMITGLEHRPRERVLVASFKEAGGAG